MKASVYFIYAEGTSLFKIGASSDPGLRLLNLQKQCPTKLFLVDEVEVDDPRHFRLERQLQHHFEAYRFGGNPKLTSEWFALPPDWRERTASVVADFLAPDVVAELLTKGERKYHESIAWRRAEIRKVLEQIWHERQQRRALK